MVTHKRVDTLGAHDRRVNCIVNEELYRLKIENTVKNCSTGLQALADSSNFLSDG